MKRKYVNDLLKTLNQTKKYLNEAYIFEDDYEGEDYEGGQGYDEGGYGEEAPYEGGQGYDEGGYGDEMPYEGGHEGGGEVESEEEKKMHAEEIVKHEPIIGKIREIAIDGLKKYANHPTSDIYEFFKKVFLESDKVLTDTGASK